MVSKITIIKNKLALMPPDEFQQLTDLPYNEHSFHQIFENLIQAVKKANVEIEMEKVSLEKQMGNLNSEFEDY